MPDPSDHYIRVRDFAKRFSLDESTVYKMIERGEIRAIRIGKKALRIPSPELERFLDRRPEPGDASDSELTDQVDSFKERTGRDPHEFVRLWRAGEIEDTPEQAQLAIEALALRAAVDRSREELAEALKGPGIPPESDYAHWRDRETAAGWVREGRRTEAGS